MCCVLCASHYKLCNSRAIAWLTFFYIWWWWGGPLFFCFNILFILSYLNAIIFTALTVRSWAAISLLTFLIARHFFFFFFFLFPFSISVLTGVSSLSAKRTYLEYKCFFLSEWVIITVSLYTSSAFIGDWSRVHFISLANTSLFSSSQLYSTLLYCALKEKRLETKNIPINKHQGAMVTLSLSCFFIFFILFFNI